MKVDLRAAINNPNAIIVIYGLDSNYTVYEIQ